MTANRITNVVLGLLFSSPINASVHESTQRRRASLQCMRAPCSELPTYVQVICKPRKSPIFPAVQCGATLISGAGSRDWGWLRFAGGSPGGALVSQSASPVSCH